MKRVITVLGILIGVLVLVKVLPILMLFLPPVKGQRLETWETTNTPFRIRVDRHAEANGGFVPGAYYVFQSAASDSEWREIMTFRHDDPVDIPREQVRFANDQVAYVFMSWMYAVTTDGGRSWRVSEMWDLLPSGERCLYGCIEDLRIDANGAGEVRLNIIASPRDQTKILKTNDFGRSWRES
jgi:hypothetical protein